MAHSSGRSFIDLDVGETKPYDSKQDALDAVEYLMPRPVCPRPSG